MAELALSIVIVNYNTREQLEQCLLSIAAYKGEIALETLVIDNGSQDGSAAMVEAHSEVYGWIRLIHQGHNSWFTGGNNLGIFAAQGEFVHILNPDTLIQEGALQRMLAYLRERPEVGAITCKMRFPDLSTQRTCSMIPSYVDLVLGYSFLGVLLSPVRDRRRRVMWYSDWQRDYSRSVEVIPGSNMMASRQLLQGLGGMDAEMLLYFCEDDLCKRILEQGLEIHFLSDALILHEENASTKQVQRLASRIYFDDLLVFTKKHYGRLGAYLLRALIWPTRYGMDLAQRLRGERAQLGDKT